VQVIIPLLPSLTSRPGPEGVGVRLRKRIAARHPWNFMPETNALSLHNPGESSLY
jgi:hypothetical protein